MYNKDMVKVNFIIDNKGNKLFIGESGVNIFKNDSLVFSIEDSKIVFFNLKSNILSPDKEIEGYAFPLLAPNNKYMYAMKMKPPYPIERINTSRILE